MARGIYIWMYKVVTGKDRKRILSGRKKVEEFPIDHDFGFDILDNKAWRRFLLNYKTKRKVLLPTVTRAGEPIAYKVDIVGMEDSIRQAIVDKDGIHPPGLYYTVFPGYATVNPRRKLLDLTIYGVLKR